MTEPRRALIVVDVQQEYFTGILQIQAPSRDESLARVVAALDVAAEHDLPVVVVQHELPVGAPVFAQGSESWSLHPEVERRLQPTWKRATKDKGSVFAGTDVAAWLAEQLHETLLVLLHSNFAAVATTEAWTEAVASGSALPKSDLGTSATQGRAAFAG